MGLSAGIAGAQEPLDGVADGPRVMTLRDCMAYAISNSTKIRIQQAAIVYPADQCADLRVLQLRPKH